MANKTTLRMLAAGLLLLAVAPGAAHAQLAGFDRDAMLAAHDKWRGEVGVGRLQYSMQLEAEAQAWADHLRKGNACHMQHSNPGGRYGENLYWASAVIWSDGRRELQPVTARMVVDSWGGEKADYDYAAKRCKPGKTCGHYTQVVWKSTTEVGCGRAVCADSKEQIWVCRYRPAGNVVGQQPY